MRERQLCDRGADLGVDHEDRLKDDPGHAVSRKPRERATELRRVLQHTRLEAQPYALGGRLGLAEKPSMKWIIAVNHACDPPGARRGLLEERDCLARELDEPQRQARHVPSGPGQGIHTGLVSWSST